MPSGVVLQGGTPCSRSFRTPGPGPARPTPCRPVVLFNTQPGPARPAIDEATPGEVAEQQLGAGLGHAVRRVRRRPRPVAHLGYAGVQPETHRVVAAAAWGRSLDAQAPTVSFLST